jgi:hypothetical protein
MNEAYCPSADAKRKLITLACVSPIFCPKVYEEGEDAVCMTYLDPVAVQCRCGRKDACGVMPRPNEEAIKKSKLKRKFGSRTRGTG